MKPLFLFNKWRGINDRVSPRDLPENSLVECKDFEFDYTLGNLVLSKGWSKLINADLGGFASGLIEFAILKGEYIVKYLMTMIESNILRFWYYDNDWSGVQSLNGGDIGSEFNEFHPIFANNAITSGVGNGIANIPFWYGYLKYKRFYDSDVGDYDEEVDGMYFLPEELKSPFIKQGTSEADFGDAEVLITNFTFEDKNIPDASDFTAGRIMDLTCTYLYEGGQESSLPIAGKTDNKFQRVVLWAYESTSAVDSFYFELYLSKKFKTESRLKRVKGINIYARERFGTGLAGSTNWRYVRTFYLDDTFVNVRYLFSISDYLPPQIENWEKTSEGNYHWNTNQYKYDSSPQYPNRIYICADEYNNFIDIESHWGFTPIAETMPNYKYSAVFKAVKYVGNLLYPKYFVDSALRDIYPATTDIYKIYNIDDQMRNLIHYSLPSQYNLIPQTNYIKIEEPVSALGTTDNYLLIFSENICHVYNSNQQKVSEWKGCGCIAHDAIAYFNGICFYPGKDNVFMFDRYYPQDISSMKIMAAYKEIPIESKRRATGAINYAKKEYILSIYGHATFIYNITTGEWRMKNKNLVAITNRIDSDVIGINYGGDQYIVTFEDTYEYIDEVYTAWALTKKMTGLQADNLVKSLLLGYVCYKSSDSLTIEILVDSVVAQTIVLDAQTNMKSVQFGCGGVNGENIQLKISITTSASTEFGEIDFIKLWGDVHDIQGG